MEQALIREAVTRSSVTESIGRRLGDELIAASRDVIGAWDAYYVAALRPSALANNPMTAPIERLRMLVGTPTPEQPVKKGR